MAELNIPKNLEESTFTEKVISPLDEFQETKEAGAESYFKFPIQNLKAQQASERLREQEGIDARAKTMLEMTELIAKYVKEEIQDREEILETKEFEEKTERRKAFQGSQSKTILSVSDLYDTILWSVATSDIGLSSTESDSFESWDDDDEE